MTNDECQMTKECRMPNDEGGLARTPSLGLRTTDGFRASSFVIRHSSIMPGACWADVVRALLRRGYGGATVGLRWSFGGNKAFYDFLPAATCGWWPSAPLRTLEFGFGASFVIRHSSFIIPRS